MTYYYNLFTNILRAKSVHTITDRNHRQLSREGELPEHHPSTARSDSKQDTERCSAFSLPREYYFSAAPKLLCSIYINVLSCLRQGQDGLISSKISRHLVHYACAS